MGGQKKYDSSTLIARLIAEMDSRGINQDALATLLGISQGHLSKIREDSRRPPDGGEGARPA
jgi:transcriptional regulator with XRE-family HTH domain